MRIEEAVIQRLDATSAVTTLATGGIWNLVAPENETRPHVRVHLVDEPKRAHLRGYNSVLKAVVQVDIFTKPTDATPDASTVVGNLSEEIEAALGPRPFSVGGSPAMRVLYVRREDRRQWEPDVHDDYQHILVFSIWHRNP